MYSKLLKTTILRMALLLVFVGGITPIVNSQTRQYIFLEDWTYDLIDYYINNGRMSFNHVLNQPFEMDSVLSQPVNLRWFDLQKQYYRHFYGTQDHVKAIIYFRDNYSLASSSEKFAQDHLKAPIYSPILFDNSTRNHYNFAGQINFLFPHLTLLNRTLINSEFKDDLLFFGETREWIYGRTNDAYLNTFFGPFDFFIGRMDKNWGTLNEFGLILSNNPYSWDHFQFSFTLKKFKFSMIITRLEDTKAVFMEAPDSVFTARKFMTLHRVDFSPSKKLQFSLTEGAIYGGTNRDFEFGYLNPMNYFYLIQRNNRQYVSGIWALDLFYKPTPKLNIFSQLLIDDFIVNNEETDDRARYPDRLGVNLKFSEADLLMPGAQTALNYTRVWNRTYQARRSYENFHYYGKGLGFPVASTEQLELSWKYFNIFPALIKLKLSASRRGDVDLTDVFMLEKEEFPVGVVEKSLAANLAIRYFMNHSFWFSSSFTWEKFTNYGNIEKNDFSNLKFVIGVHMNFTTGLKLD